MIMNYFVVTAVNIVMSLAAMGILLGVPRSETLSNHQAISFLQGTNSPGFPFFPKLLNGSNNCRLIIASKSIKHNRLAAV